MNIIVVGCGKIGSTLLESLSAEGHDVEALEKDAHVLEQITNMYDVMGVCGNGADCETLEEAAMVHGLDVDLLVDQINDYLAQ